jgi:hypothetical protein
MRSSCSRFHLIVPPCCAMVENKRRFRISERISVVEVLYLRSRTWRATVDGTHVENVPALHKWNETGVWPIPGTGYVSFAACVVCGVCLSRARG